MTQLRHATLALLAVVGFAQPGRADEGELPARAREGMRKAGGYWAATVASHGGYVWEYSTDLVTRRRGESRDLPSTTVWVQAGTPLVAQTFLRAYEVSAEKPFLEAAVAAARCLAWGQLESGGWHYSIEFDLRRNQHRYHHLDAGGAKLRNTTTFDDNNTQSAARFLMDVDRHVDDPEIDAAIQRALTCFLEAQYKGGNWDGAWPQRHPPPKRGYGALPTFNDNTMRDCLKTMLQAYRQYGKPEYLASVKRCIEFCLRAQQPDPQGAWAQQYDKDLKPAWARRFEPPSITGGESKGVADLLLDMYVELGDTRCLEAVRRAVAWYKRSRVGGTDERGVWARFYEVDTNRPLYFTKTYKLTHSDDDLPVHYAFKSNFGVNSLIRRFEQTETRGRERCLALRDRDKTPAEWAAAARELGPKVEEILAEQDELGRWVKAVPNTEQVRDKEGRVGYVRDKTRMLDMMYTQKFVRNMRVLADYLCAVQAGPQAPAPPALPARSD